MLGFAVVRIGMMVSQDGDENRLVIYEVDRIEEESW